MTTFHKRYIEDLHTLSSVPLKSRPHYYLHRSLLATKQGFAMQAEPVARQEDIESAGIMCRPFWNDALDGKALDPEGRAFVAYRAEHPEFNLMVRKSILARLLIAQSRLPSRYRFVLKAGLRPIEVQRETFDGYLRLAQSEHPDWDEQQVYRHTAEYVTDPGKHIPPHATGAAIDISLWDTTDRCYVDVGSPINVAEDSAWGSNHTGLSEAQVYLRSLLRDSMLSAGFAPLASEWWHYSYGDQRWAVYYDKPHALYAVVELDRYNGSAK